MVSDDESGMQREENRGVEEQGAPGSMGQETGSEVGESKMGVGQTETPEMTAEAPRPRPKSGGRRAALRIIRENVDRVSKDLAGFRKNHESNSKRLEKQVSSLRNDISALKSQIAKETARLREKQESATSRLLAKVTKPASPSKGRSSGKKKSSRSRGKK